ncbi:hypothetical protein KNE206_76650 [Kitasatospora sp. NE20-6]
MTDFLLQAGAETLGALAATGALGLGTWAGRRARCALRTRALRRQLARTTPALTAPADAAAGDTR